MQKGLIGIIVPVYKVEKYITECIESILEQTYTKFRLIIVDDGTPDNAGKICEEYAKKDSRITIIHQENAGVTRARARGVEEADDCEWITFVDSDDTITTDALATLLSFTNDDTDIVFSVFDKETIPNQMHITNVQYRHWATENLYYIGAACGKLINKSLFNNFVFDIPSRIKIHEDTIMNIRIAFNAKKGIAFCNKCIYIYRCNENSAMQTFKKDIKYEEDLHEHIKTSIPIDEVCIYIKDTIPYRLKQWRIHYLYKYNVKDMETEKFYIELKKDIIEHGIKQGFIEKVLFNCTNTLTRFFIITLKKVGNLINHIFKTVLTSLHIR